jgi:phenylpyruvate tautomerase PptA (4-oxalocrotonate tautomerase family)
MPLYNVTTETGVLSKAAKADLANKLTTFHSEYASVPSSRVHIVFQEYAPGNGFTAGQRAAPAALTLLIRTGRSSEFKHELLRRLWGLLQAATGVPADQIFIGIQEVPPNQAIEMAQIMPGVAVR